ncbi:MULTISPECIES: hypothetical protein [unclassified Nocardiopsis]|uniref:hypothetical protein n=1 Tax=unclassified Nocardiopsis TaxID=2649073 RepID=UPI00135A298D|nr:MULTISPECIES: hypothetical protein [unclassified Nocardiopsis]
MWHFGRRPGRAARSDDIGALLLPEPFAADPGLRTVCEAVREGDAEAGVPLLVESREDPELRTLRAAELGRAAAERPEEVAVLVEHGADRADAVLWLGYALLARALDRPAAVSTAETKAASAALHEARETLQAAVALRSDDAVAWEGLQRVELALRAPRSERDRTWRETVARAPHLFSAHVTRVRSVAVADAGTPAAAAADEMFAFAGSVADTAPEGSPLPAVLALAHAEFLRRERARLRGEGSMELVVQQALGRLHGEAARELFSFARDWVSAAVPHPRDAQAHHLFGWALHRAGMTDAARWHLTAVGTVRCDLPWSFFGDPTAELVRTLTELGVDPGRAPDVPPPL